MVHAGATSADTRGRKAPRYVAGLRSTTIRALAGDPLSPRRGIRLPLRRRTLGRGLRWRTHHDHLDLLGRTAEWRWNALQGPGHRDPGAGTPPTGPTSHQGRVTNEDLMKAILKLSRQVAAKRPRRK